MSALPLPPASTLRRPPRSPTAAAAFSVVPLLAFEFLNFTGFCYRDMRNYSSLELIDRAIGYRGIEGTPDGQVKAYASVREFHELNPNCCALYARSPYSEDMTFFRVFGIYRIVAELWYRYSDTDPKYPFYQAYISMDACGGYAGFNGTQEETGPTPDMRR